MPSSETRDEWAGGVSASQRRGRDPDWRDLADAAWLADFWLRSDRSSPPLTPIEPGPEVRQADAPPAPEPDRGPLEAAEPEAADGPGPVPAAELLPSPSTPGTFLTPSAELSGEGSSTALRHVTPAVLPVDSVLARRPVARDVALMAQALHRMARRVPSRKVKIVDEVVTAEHSLGEGGCLLPVLVPAQETVFDLVVLIDAAPTMPVWERHWRSLVLAAQQCGAFRDVRLARVSVGPSGQPVLLWPSGARSHPGELVDSQGTRVHLVVTDGLAHGWAAPSADVLLTLLARAGPTALVHLLPPHLRHRSSLYPYPARLGAGGFGVPNTRLVHTPRRDDSASLRAFPETDGLISVPVLSLKATSLAAWAHLVSGDRGVLRDMPAIPAGALAKGVPAPGLWAPAAGSPQQVSLAVRHFLTLATPMARRLAAHMAVVPFEYDIVASLIGRLLPDFEPTHLAEVLMGGLIDWRGLGESSPGAERIRPDFAPGVRKALLATTTRRELARAVQAFGEIPDPKRRGRRLQEILADPENAPLPSSDDESWAELEGAVLNALSGPYAERARLIVDAQVFGPRGPVTAIGSGTPAGADPAGSGSSQCNALAAAETGGGGVAQNSRTDGLVTEEVDSSPATVPRLEGSATPHLQASPPLPAPDALPVPASLPAVPRTPAVMGNVPPRNQYFTGREELLASVDAQLRQDSTAAVLPHALHGMGGVGKSQIAVEYIYRHRSEYNVIWWVPAESETLVLGALSQLAARLGLDVSREANRAVPAVREALRTGVPYSNWLLVFDNAEDVETVRSYFPTDGPGKVIVTSRNRDWERIATPLSVDVFRRDESISLLQRRARHMSLEDADRLAKALGDLPLAIEQAGAWHANTAMPVAEYLALLEQRKPEILNLDPSPDYPVSVAAAWDISLDRLAQEAPGARQLLDLCACMAPEPVPLSMLRAGRDTQVPEVLRRVLDGSLELGRASRLLNRYSLVRTNHGAGTLQMHRLLQNVLVARLSPEERAVATSTTHLLMANNRPTPAYADPAQWPAYQALVPHIIASEAFRSTDEYVRELVYDSVLYLYYWGDHDTSLRLAKGTHEAWREESGEDNLHVIRIAKILAFLLRLKNEGDEAFRLNALSLQRSRQDGVPTEDLVDSLSQYAGALRYAGRFEEARDSDKEAEALARDPFGPDDVHTLLAAHSYGVSLRLCGDFKAAEELDEETVRQWVNVQGPTHLLTLNTQNGLAIDIREGGDYPRARLRQEETYQSYRHAYGEEYVATLRAAYNLAVCLRRDGALPEAAALSELTLARLTSRYGANHGDVLAVASNVTVDRRLAGNLEGSHNLGRQTVDLYRQTLGPDHANTLVAMANLAATLRAMKEFTAAAELDEQVIETLTRTLGPRHITTLTAELGRAHDHYYRFDFAGARDTDRAAREALTEVAGPGHPVTLAALANLSLDLRGLGQGEEADALQRQAVVGFARVVAEGHPWSVAARFNRRIECDMSPLPL
ncbi:FxSxx-COOH system tetratricopeptide repeat protein [Streptomyces sp. NPDC005820]|uniref:FxSxx-COOH system tetratricopeptide repeat protein n=1 Tax=Streptomyces sp. NPDC005820 TaxID=3157069 RepID=UPI0033D8DAB9